MNLLDKVLGKKWTNLSFEVKPWACMGLMLLLPILCFMVAFVFPETFIAGIFILLALFFIVTFAYYAGYYFVVASKQKPEQKLIYYLIIFMGGPFSWFGAAKGSSDFEQKDKKV